MEQWKPIEGFEVYSVSSHGRIRNETTGLLRMTSRNKSGVVTVVLQKDGRAYGRSVHKLVAQAFLRQAPTDSHVPSHKNGNKEDCSVDNLEWLPRWTAVRRTKEFARSEPLVNRRILRVNDNVIFENSREAARAIDGFEEYVVTAARQGESGRYKGFHFEFL